MKIGIFDSGLGGLVVLKELKRKLPKYDYLYLGDTKNLPYGDKSQAQIFNLTKKAVEYLFKQDCAVVIVACNTSSSEALRRLQREYLPKSKYKDRKILGIIRPTVENVRQFKTIAIIGTRRTIDSGAYSRELENMGWSGKLLVKATPKLVPMIESDRMNEKVIKQYLTSLKNAQALILACTHYGIIKSTAAKYLQPGAQIISQDKLLPAKLRQYLKRHPEVSRKLNRNSKLTLSITKANPRYQKLADKWFGKVKLSTVKY